jgi:competence protein ComEA
MKTILFIIIGILAGILLASLIWLAATPPRGQPITLSAPPTPLPLMVHVTGAVANPGLYQLSPGSRVNDAILAAGGFLTNADKSFINLAAPAKDGDKIHVPELMPGLSIGGTGLLVNINSATAAELENLPGIGPTLAQKIVDYRTQYGFFNTIDEIKNVPGIGESVFSEIQSLITVGS